MPIGILADRIKGNIDEIKMLFVGNCLMGFSFVLLVGIKSAQDYYLLQIMFGLGAALNLVDWRKLFAKSLDRGHEGMEYGVYETIMSMSIALMSILGGYLAAIDSSAFDLVIQGTGVLIIGSNLWLVPMYLQQSNPRGKGNRAK